LGTVSSPRATRVDELIPDQLRSISSSSQRLFIEAEPGSGKTTVSAMRFGVQRFRRATREESRGVVAMSFTRSATTELRQRIQRFWGSSALTWPHRVVTVDTIVYDLLQHLLRRGLINWPGGHNRLEVRDSWASITETKFVLDRPVLMLTGAGVTPRSVREQRRSLYPPGATFWRAIRQGLCTHEEVRSVLGNALSDAALREALVAFMARAYRSLIVDEVFDANALDIAVIQLACDAGVAVTVVGDPWQALYAFRGARPREVRQLIHERDLHVLPLRAAFRWRSDEQQELAEALRRQEGVVLASAPEARDCDVVLASEWKSLWRCGDAVIPLALGSFKGGRPEAATTLLLDQLTRTLLSLEATYRADALRTLGLDERLVVGRLEPLLEDVLRTLSSPGRDAAERAYAQLAEAVTDVGGRPLPGLHWRYRERLELIQAKIRSQGGTRLIPGLTVHQAKGREWDKVAINLTMAEREALAKGLTQDQEGDRRIYVACTRARYATRSLEISNA
jgi:DNA helicase-2/ATP-dependent DNA helicase PcrA